MRTRVIWPSSRATTSHVRAACELLFGRPMRRTRSVWIRGLRLYRLATQHAALIASVDDMLGAIDGHVHALSRFRSVRHPERFAVYSMHEPDDGLGEPTGPGDHRLDVVRE